MISNTAVPSFPEHKGRLGRGREWRTGERNPQAKHQSGYLPSLLPTQLVSILCAAPPHPMLLALPNHTDIIL